MSSSGNNRKKPIRHNSLFARLFPSTSNNSNHQQNGSSSSFSRDHERRTQSASENYSSILGSGGALATTTTIVAATFPGKQAEVPMIDIGNIHHQERLQKWDNQRKETRDEISRDYRKKKKNDGVNAAPLDDSRRRSSLMNTLRNYLVGSSSTAPSFSTNQTNEKPSMTTSTKSTTTTTSKFQGFNTSSTSTKR